MPRPRAAVLHRAEVCGGSFFQIIGATNLEKRVINFAFFDFDDTGAINEINEYLVQIINGVVSVSRVEI